MQVTDDEAELQGGGLGCVPALDGQGLLDEGVVDEAVSEVRSILESEVGVAVDSMDLMGGSSRFMQDRGSNIILLQSQTESIEEDSSLLVKPFQQESMPNHDDWFEIKNPSE